MNSEGYAFPRGAAYLAMIFARYEREDLSEALSDYLLERQNPDDFGVAKHGLTELSRLLTILHEREAPIVKIERTVESIATPDWLESCFREANIFSLTENLNALARRQPTQVLSRFWCPGLDLRIRQAVINLEATQDDELAANLRFIAVCALAGRVAPLELVTKLVLDKISRLPLEVLAHKPDASDVDNWRWQLWIGLRLLASADIGQMSIDASTIDQTLSLWKSNLEESGANVASNLRRINESMVLWLSACALSGTGLLLPGHEPLRHLTGFRTNPDLSSVPDL